MTNVLAIGIDLAGLGLGFRFRLSKYTNRNRTMIEITSVTFEAEIVSSNNERETDAYATPYVVNNR